MRSVTGSATRLISALVRNRTARSTIDRNVIGLQRGQSEKVAGLVLSQLLPPYIRSMLSDLSRVLVAWVVEVIQEQVHLLLLSVRVTY